MEPYDESVFYLHESDDEDSMNIDMIIEIVASRGKKRSGKLPKKSVDNGDGSNSRRPPKLYSQWLISLFQSLPWENIILILSCLSVSVDPLFLYLPIINEDLKCVALDKRLTKIALILRTITDVFALPPAILFLRELTSFYQDFYCLWSSIESLKLTAVCIWMHFITILYFLPIPQIIILIFFPRMRGAKSLNTMKFLNVLILLQYVARVYPSYYLCKRINKRKDRMTFDFARWIPGVVNLFLYILASHVLGAFWYFFSFQRKIDCWGNACRSENGCNLSTFHCNENRTLKNVSLILNNLCPINPPNATMFDFGIFLGALQSGMTESTDFTQKLLQCFSWGLRNLSSFASNLNSSTYAWESVFVICISISGLLLFIYLLGHLQKFMQATDRIWQKMRLIDPDITVMSSEYGISDFDISRIVRKKFEDNEDLTVENIFSILPWLLRKHLKRYIFLETLAKVSLLQHMDKKVLYEICKHLEPVNYAAGSYIIREGEPLDMMIFVTQGIVLTYSSNINIGGASTGSSSTTPLAKRDFFGEELISWAASASTRFSDLSHLPNSPRTLKSHKKVEVFAIKATDLEDIVHKFREDFSRELRRHPTDNILVEITDDNSKLHSAAGGILPQREGAQDYESC